MRAVLASLVCFAAVARAERLPNGIELALVPEPGAGEIAVVVWVPVGSRDDVAPRTGLAHLFEHLMFTGSKNVPEGEHDRLVEEAGGWSNAFTTPDATVYTTVATAGALERVLFLEADRLAGLRLEARTLATQKEVVANERRQRYENRPYGAAEGLLSAALWPAGHPYARLAIGEPAEVAAVTLDEARAYFGRAYTPEGLLVVVAGDFVPERARALVDKTLGRLAARPRPERIEAPALTPLGAPVNVQADDAVQTSRVYLAWPTPAWYGTVDAPLAVTAGLLGGGKSSRLWRKLVVETPLVENVEAAYVEGEWAGVFQIVATVRPGVEPAKVIAAVDEELAALAGRGPSRGELERARNQHEAGLLEAQEPLSGRALQAARWLAATGSADRLNETLRAVRAVGAPEVRVVVSRFLSAKTRVTLTIGPVEE
jgi:zinc protease